MSFKVPSPVPYPAISRNLHWLMAIFILFMFASGWLREFVPGEYRGLWMSIHKGCGITILALLMARIAARVILTIPKNGKTIADRAAGAVHGLLYIAMICSPLSGWLMVSAQGRGIAFGPVTIPPLMEKAADKVSLLKEIHEVSAYAFAGLVSVHILAALYHVFYLRDDVIYRMIGKRKSANS